MKCSLPVPSISCSVAGTCSSVLTLLQRTSNRLLSTLTIIVFSYASISMSATAQQVSIDDLRWKNRLIVSFHSGADSDQQQLIRWVAQNHCRLGERDTVVLSIRDQTASVLTNERIIIDSVTVAGLQKSRALPESEFEMLLIGKDGGIKSRATTADDLDSFIELIDGMPMRQREAANSGSNC